MKWIGIGKNKERKKNDRKEERWKTRKVDKNVKKTE